MIPELPVPAYIVALAASLALLALLARVLQTRALVKSGFSIVSGALGFLVVAAILGAVVVSTVALEGFSEEFLSATIESVCVIPGNPGVLPEDAGALAEGLEAVALIGRNSAGALEERLGERLLGAYLMTGYLVLNSTRTEPGIYTTAYAVLYAGGFIAGEKALILGPSGLIKGSEALDRALRSLGYRVERLDPAFLYNSGLDRAIAEFASALLLPEGSRFWLPLLEEMLLEMSSYLREDIVEEPVPPFPSPSDLVEPIIEDQVELVALLPGDPDPGIIEYLKGPGSPASIAAAIPVTLVLIDYNPRAYLNPASPTATRSLFEELKSESWETVWAALGHGPRSLSCGETPASERVDIVSSLYSSIVVGSLIILLVLVAAAILAVDPLAYNAVAAMAPIMGLVRLRGVTYRRLTLSLLAVTVAVALFGGSAGVALVQLVPGALGGPAPSMNKFTWGVVAVVFALYTMLLWWSASKALSSLRLEAAARGHPMAAEVAYRNEPPGKLAVASLALGLYHSVRGVLGLPLIFQYIDERGPPENAFLAVLLGVAGFIEVLTLPLTPLLVAYGFARLLTWISPSLISRIGGVGGSGGVSLIASGLARWIAPRAMALVVLAVFASVILASSGASLHITYTGLEEAVLGSVGGEVVGYKVLEALGQANLTLEDAVAPLLGYDVEGARALASRAVEACPGSLAVLIVKSGLDWDPVEADAYAYMPITSDYAYIVLVPSERALEKLEWYASVDLEGIIRSPGLAAVWVGVDLGDIIISPGLAAVWWVEPALGSTGYLAVSADPDLLVQTPAGWAPGIAFVRVELAARIEGGLPGAPLAENIYRALGYSIPRAQWVVTGEWVLDEAPGNVYYAPEGVPPPVLMVMADRGCEGRLEALGLDLVVLSDGELEGYVERVGGMLELVNLSYYLRIASLTLLAMVALASAMAAYGASDVLKEILALVRLRGAGPALVFKVIAVLWGLIAGLSVAMGLLAGVGAGAAITVSGGDPAGIVMVAPVDLVLEREPLRLDEGLTIRVLWELARPSLGVRPETIALALLLVVTILLPPLIVGLRVFVGEAYRGLGRR